MSLQQRPDRSLQRARSVLSTGGPHRSTRACRGGDVRSSCATRGGGSVNKNDTARMRERLLASTIATILGAGSAAKAQEPAPSAGPVEEVTVTGSRIVRRDFTANSPIMTVYQELFDETMSIGVDHILNQLPQFVPAVTQFTTTETQSTATVTPGASTVSLRGLGANRNLVLIDGRRAMPVNASGAVDTNMIPS